MRQNVHAAKLPLRFSTLLPHVPCQAPRAESGHSPGTQEEEQCQLQELHGLLTCGLTSCALGVCLVQLPGEAAGSTAAGLGCVVWCNAALQQVST